jgi:phosphoribosylaminoimidazole-succinocarboxamide synthase
MLMVASDRISAFDVVMGQPIPGKGAPADADGAVLVRPAGAGAWCPTT